MSQQKGTSFVANWLVILIDFRIWTWKIKLLPRFGSGDIIFISPRDTTFLWEITFSKISLREVNMISPCWSWNICNIFIFIIEWNKIDKGVRIPALPSGGSNAMTFEYHVKFIVSLVIDCWLLLWPWIIIITVINAY